MGFILAGRFRIRNRLLIAYLIPFLLVLGGLSFFTFYHTKWSLDREFSRGLMGVAATTALLVEPENFLAFSPGDENSRAFQRLAGLVSQIREVNSVEAISLVTREGKIIADSQGGRIGSHFSRFELDRQAIELVLRGEKQVSILFSGPDRRYYKEAYYPLMAVNIDEGKQGLGFVAVEGSADYFRSLSRLRRDLTLGGVVGILVVGVISFWLARRLVKPVQRLVVEAERIGSGDFQSPIAVEGEGEIGFLAQTLERMRRSLYERDRFLNLMLRGVAHEVRNPLGGMELYAGLLAERFGNSGPEAEYVGKIRREIANLRKVVEEFLEYARGGGEVQREEVRLEPFFRDVVEALAREAESAGVRIILEVEKDEVVFLDPRKIRPAVMNLIMNSIIASSEGAVVEVQVKVQERSLQVSVKDQGVGIPEEDFPHLFEPFFTTRKRGSGIGLALVKRAVDLHGGRVEVKSRLGEGTQITLIIPLINVSPVFSDSGKSGGC